MGRAVERRLYERYDLWFPLWLTSEGRRDRLAIGQDTSLVGLRVASASALPVGSIVTVTFRLPAEDGASAIERTARGRVMRVDANTDEQRTIWPYQMVVELEEPLLEIHALLEVAEPMRMH
jgi:hypothetical protein